jgi:molecular chaperone GrpE
MTEKEEIQEQTETEEVQGAQQEAQEEKEKEPLTVTVTDIELAHLRQSAKEAQDKYLRVLAESENARKRLQKEREEMIQYSLRSLIADFLGPIDQMENALKHAASANGEVKQWSIGFEMILSHFKDVLASHNVHSFTSEGEAFDPHFHEAIETVETTDHPEGVVIEETVKGYKMGDKVLRAAKVKVSKAPKEEK